MRKEKINKEKRQQFKSENWNSIAEIVIQSGISIMKGFATDPLIFGWVNLALTSALAAAQIGLISSKQYTPLERGGVVGAGESVIVGDKGSDYSRAEIVTPLTPSGVLPAPLTSLLLKTLNNEKSQTGSNSSQIIQNNVFETADLVEARNELERKGVGVEF